MHITILEHLLYEHHAFCRRYYRNPNIEPGKIHQLSTNLHINYARLNKHGALVVYVSTRVPVFYSRQDATYHCMFHALEVAHKSYFNCLEEGGSEKEALTAYIAGVFHDADYIVSRDDSLNVIAAINAFKGELKYKNPLVKIMQDYDINPSDVEDIILCTQFDKTTGTFPIKPTTLPAKVVRDADLLGCTSPLWPSLLSGLAVEMGVDPDSWIDVHSFLTRQYDFISSQQMQIDNGKSYTQRSLYLSALREVIDDL